jgi:pimeloyl-ACP methyl ester carboxylesterase
MRMKALILFAAAAGVVLSASAPAFAQSGSAAAPGQEAGVRSGYAPVDGLHLYYEIRGTGKPLVLLHGGLGSIEMFGPVLTMLAASREVIAVDLQDHGRTADINRPLRYELMGDDIAALLGYLGIEKADVMGYSLGAGVALQVAIRHPEVVRKLIVVSGAFKRDGWYPEILAGEAQMGAAAAEQMKQTPMYQLYSAMAPRPQDWPILLAKLGDLLKRDYDWSKEVKAIRAPTLLVFADQDAIRIEHIMAFFALFGGGQRAPSWDGSGRPRAELAILPGVTHYNIFMSSALASVVTPFLDSER